MKLPMEVLDELYTTLKGYEAIEDLLCENRDLHMVSPDNLCLLLRVLRERFERDLGRLRGKPLKVAA